MVHDWTVVGTDTAGDFIGSCSCGYGAIGGYEADLIANLTAHAEA